jgi:hypothetical protein
MFQPIHEPIDAFVAFRPGIPYPALKAFRWRHRRYDVSAIESVQRCTAAPRPAGEEEPRSYGHFSSRWTRGAEFSTSRPSRANTSLCYRVRVGGNEFELRLDPGPSQWVLEGIHIETDSS